ncbi:MAG TPA: hypothetical protein VHJ18_22315 [Streptosporangiaceae bacterium]|nr:hypothetical protein [Streptosporangiaceae bacterium]
MPTTSGFGITVDVIGIGGELAPWVRVDAGHRVRVLVALQLDQEPVDSAGVIAANGPLMECRVRYEPPRPPSGIDFGRDPAEELVDV